MKNNLHFKKNIFLILVAVLSISGCSKFAKVDSENIRDTLPERPVELSAVTDTTGKTPRVVIRTKKPVDPELATKKNLLQRLQQSFDRELGKLPGMIVERSLSKSVGNEIELSEIYGKDSGRQDADYVIMIALDDYVSNQTSEQKESIFSKKKYTRCAIEAEYKGWVRVLTIPALEKTFQWEFKEDDSKSYDMDSAAQCRNTFKQQLQKLQSTMIDNTVCTSKTDYLNALAPTGHILSVKHDKESVLLETSLGSSVNASKGNTVYFYHELSFNPYAEGVITSITPKKSWIKLKSLEEEETIYLHDWVRPHYSGVINAVKCLF